MDIHFVSGGTQANLVALAAMLKPFESVIAAESAHASNHEAGAIEATGHKIHEVKSSDGKVTPSAVRDIVGRHTNEHMVKPKAVFLSQSTEAGTIYKKKELSEISATCKELGLYLYLDGARLGSAVTAAEADVALADVPELTDMFYIGGTKNGALLGEAVVVVNPDFREHFRYHLKQRGALLAKGRLLGIQFVELFRADLFFDLARHANTLAKQLAEGLAACGYSFLYPPSTNQIFPVLPDRVVNKLKEKYGFYVWSKTSSDSDSSVIRLVTSWATEEDSAREFLQDLTKCSHSPNQ